MTLSLSVRIVADLCKKKTNFSILKLINDGTGNAIFYKKKKNELINISSVPFRVNLGSNPRKIQSRMKDPGLGHES